MRLPTRFRLLSAFLLIGLAAPHAVPAGPPAREKKEGEIPFFCSTQVWSASFEVVSARYDRSANQLIWTLKAKKDTRVASYVAFVGDGDGVELTTNKVKFTPASAEVKAGTQLQAVVSLQSLSPKEVAALTIRERR